MIQVTFNIGYSVVEFEFKTLYEATSFIDTALTRYVSDKDEKALEVHIKKCAEGGNPKMAHDDKDHLDYDVF